MHHSDKIELDIVIDDKSLKKVLILKRQRSAGLETFITPIL